MNEGSGNTSINRRKEGNRGKEPNILDRRLFLKLGASGAGLAVISKFLGIPIFNRDRNTGLGEGAAVSVGGEADSDNGHKADSSGDGSETSSKKKERESRFITLQENYVVKDGETWDQILRSFEQQANDLGYTYNSLNAGTLAKNDIENTNNLQKDQEIDIVIDKDW